jgi:hypothetical protein
MYPERSRDAETTKLSRSTGLAKDLREFLGGVEDVPDLHREMTWVDCQGEGKVRGKG